MDAVIYLASTTVPSTSNTDVSADITCNLVPLASTLDAMRSNGMNRIVYFSSGGTVYGIADSQPVSELAPLNPVCSYGIVKLAAEKYLGMYGHLYGMRPLVLRPSNPFGPRQGHEGVQGLIATCLGRLDQGEPIQVWGDGSVVRDYLYVEDLALAAVLGIETEVSGVVNIGSGEGRSVSQVIETLSEVTGRSARVEVLNGRAFDVPHLVLCNDAAKEMLGWAPTTPFAAGVAAHWEWLLSRQV